MFLGLLTMYKVLKPEEEAESSAMASEGGLPRDPAKRREAKIAQYKREKELRQAISVSLHPHSQRCLVALQDMEDGRS